MSLNNVGFAEVSYRQQLCEVTFLLEFVMQYHIF